MKHENHNQGYPSPSPRSASSSKLSSLYVPLSPVARAERCKPCPVALVPIHGCFRPPPPSLLLLTSALSGSNTGICLYVEVTTVLIFSDASSYPARKETPVHPHPGACASTSTRPRGGRAPVYPCLHPCPRTHGEIRVRKKSGLSRAWRQATRMTLILRY